jgi:release factor glutamine methyltransferase
MTEEKLWDVVTLLKTSADFLKQKGIDEARLNAEWLLARVLDLKRFDLYLNFDRPVSPKERERYRELIRRRLSGEPLQYILGETEFFGITLKVDKRALIPRPETELLVEEVINELSKSESLMKILDVGTGSGCIAIALAKTLKASHITAVDSSPDALALAKENAELTGTHEKITFIEADALLPDFAQRFAEPFDALVSNPPYIPIAEKPTLQKELTFEPEQALFTQTGFEFYEKLCADAKTLLKPNGLLAFELHADGSATVKAIAEKHGFKNIELKKDYSGHTRMLLARKGTLDEIAAVKTGEMSKVIQEKIKQISLLKENFRKVVASQFFNLIPIKKPFSILIDIIISKTEKETGLNVSESQAAEAIIISNEVLILATSMIPNIEKKLNSNGKLGKEGEIFDKTQSEVRETTNVIQKSENNKEKALGYFKLSLSNFKVGDIDKAI